MILLANDKKISVAPRSYGMTGFRIDDLFSQKFIEALKKEMPTSVVAHLCIGFTDSKNLVAISHDRLEGKLVLDRVDIEGDGADAEQRVKAVIQILKKVLG